jgi:hypothetical protein
MFTFVCALGIALILSFAFILFQAVMLKQLSEELEKNKPPF